MRPSNENGPSGVEQSHATVDSQTKSRRLEVPYIRAIAALAVVQLHSVGETVFNFDPNLPFDERWWVGNLYYSALRWATPFFIMLSGSVMLTPGRSEPAGVFLRKRMSRILPPFALWSVVYLFYQYRGNIWDNNLPTWREVFNKVVFEDVYYHLWFIPMIIGMYLLTPTFQIFIRHAKRSDVEYFLVFSFLVTGLQHFIQNLLVVKYIGWMGYIGYYVLGYYLSQYTLRWEKWLYALAIVMLPLTAIGTWILTRQAGAYNNLVFVYFSPNVVIVSMALFYFLCKVDWQTFAARFPRINKVLLWLAPLSFGIYFVHVLIIDALKNGYLGPRTSYELFFGLPVPPVIGAFLVAIVVAVYASGLIFLLSKVPRLNRWIM